MSGEITPEEAKAAQRFTIMNLVRVGSVIAVGAGFAIVGEAVAGPYPLGLALILLGVAAFFFAPPTLAKRWKAADRGER